MLWKVVAFVAALACVLPVAAAATVTEAKDLELRAETPYRVFCADAGDFRQAGEWGVSDIPTGRVWILSSFCSQLRGPLTVTTAYADGVEVLLHELAHVGWRNPNESAAECFAFYVLRVYLRRDFGATVAQANALYVLAWRDHELRPQPYLGCPGFARDPFG